MNHLVAGLIRFEGMSPFMYQDTLGLVTVGIGNLLKTAEDACRLPFSISGEFATPDQIIRAFNLVAAMPKGLPATRYKLVPSVELTPDEVIDLATRRLNTEFLPGIQRSFPGFAGYPEGVQTALVDMSWNLGLAGLGKFRHLIDACEAGNWVEASLQCRRSTSRPERNEWTKEQFLAALETPGSEVA